jgi:hypothetical protein
MTPDLRRNELEFYCGRLWEITFGLCEGIDRLLFLRGNFVKERPGVEKESGSSWLEICERKLMRSETSRGRPSNLTESKTTETK